MQVHQAKYQHGENTPMMQEPLQTDLGDLGIGHTANEVMQGTYSLPTGSDQYVVKLLKELAFSDTASETNVAPTGMPVTVWQMFWQTAKERTASGPLDINFSVLKAGSYITLISILDATLAEIPMLSGYSPKRWQKAIDAVLLKKPGVFLAHKLCTIISFEAYFNHMNKFLGKTMLRLAQEFGHLAPEQYGSQHGHKAIDQATNN